MDQVWLGSSQMAPPIALDNERWLAPDVAFVSMKDEFLPYLSVTRAPCTVVSGVQRTERWHKPYTIGRCAKIGTRIGARWEEEQKSTISLAGAGKPCPQ